MIRIFDFDLFVPESFGVYLYKDFHAQIVNLTCYVCKQLSVVKRCLLIYSYNGPPHYFCFHCRDKQSPIICNFHYCGNCKILLLSQRILCTQCCREFCPRCCVSNQTICKQCAVNFKCNNCHETIKENGPVCSKCLLKEFIHQQNNLPKLVYNPNLNLTKKSEQLCKGCDVPLNSCDYYCFKCKENVDLIQPGKYTIQDSVKNKYIEAGNKRCEKCNCLLADRLEIHKDKYPLEIYNCYSPGWGNTNYYNINGQNDSGPLIVDTNGQSMLNDSIYREDGKIYCGECLL